MISVRGLTLLLLFSVTSFAVKGLTLSSPTDPSRAAPSSEIPSNDSAYSAAKTVNFYTYHDKPPYFFSERTALLAASKRAPGIYQTFIDHLNRAQSQWHIKLSYMPRKRVNLLLQAGNLNGAVIGVNPNWFKDKSKTRYLWTNPMFTDTDVIAVKAKRGFPYHHPRDLVSKVLALPRGYYFWGVTENIRSGKQQAIETSSELQNLKLIATDRADATILSDITLHYYEEHLFTKEVFDCLPTPHDTYTRAVLFPRSLHSAHSDLQSIIEQVSASSEWKEDLKTLVGGEGFYRERLDVTPIGGH